MNINTEDITLKTCSGCLKTYTLDFFNEKKHVTHADHLIKIVR